MMRNLRVVLALAAAMLAACSSAVSSKTVVIAPSARSPISLTSALIDRAGIVSPDLIKKVGRFTFEQDQCNDNRYDDPTKPVLTLKTTVDISRAVNEQISRAGGHAIVRLRVDARKPGNYCAVVRLSGDIVRVRGK